MEDYLFKGIHRKTGILSVIAHSALLKVRFYYTFSLQQGLKVPLYQVKELFHRTFQFRPVCVKIGKRNPKFRYL